jgi:hypothetical protein
MAVATGRGICRHGRKVRSLWYHADYTLPAWGRKLARGPKIGRHHFYLPERRYSRSEPRFTGEALTSAIKVLKEGVASDNNPDEPMRDNGKAI